MVGVPGKYKGCNTCRHRRVRCGMERPACKKCTDSERECGGYERDLTFIVGTPAQKGRCSSHPRRSTLNANPKNTSTPPRRRVTPTNATSAPLPWTRPFPPREIEVVKGNGCIFVHTHSLTLDPRYETDEGFHLPSLASSLPFFDATQAGQDFSVRGFAFIEDNIRKLSDDGDANPRARKKAYMRSSPTSAPRQEQESRTLYVFQATTEQSEDEPTFEHLLGGTSDELRAQRPAAFQSSPAHQFFARLWRPLAITHSLLQQRKTFLEQSVWCTGPFEREDKTTFDKLWDIIAKLPGICERANRTINTTDKANVNYQMRSMKAVDLLRNCSNIQGELGNWLRELGGSEEANELCPVYWALSSNPKSHENRRRSSPSAQASPFPQNEFRDRETAKLLISYWAALIIYYKMVAEVLAVAEATQDSGGSSQLAYRPSAGASPAYNGSSPQASVSNASATSPPVSINAPGYSGYSFPNTTQSYGYDATTTGTNFDPQYAPNIFLSQQQTPYMHFSTDTYPTTTSYAVSSSYAPDPGFTDTTFEPLFVDTSINMFPTGPVDPPYEFPNIYPNVHSSYIPTNNHNSSLDYLPPPQRNPTPASYISAPGSHQSHHSPANSFVSGVSSAVGSNIASHAATPPDMNAVSNGIYNIAQQNASSPSAGDGNLFNTRKGDFAGLWQNSRIENLVHIAKMIGSGLDFLLNRETDGARYAHEGEVVLMLWPLGVLEDMCGSYGSNSFGSTSLRPGSYGEMEKERLWCSEMRHMLESKGEETGRWVRSVRWKAIGEGDEEEE